MRQGLDNLSYCRTAHADFSCIADLPLKSFVVRYAATQLCTETRAQLVCATRL